MIPHIKHADGSFTVYFNATPFNFDSSHPKYVSLIECIKTGDDVEFQRLSSVGNCIENWSEGNFDFIDGFLFYEDEPVRDAVTQRIISMMEEGWDVTPMLKFLDRLYSNPSNRAVTEFYDWIQHKGLAITPDGYILGYKGVVTYDGPETEDKLGRKLKEGDLVDKYTGKSFRNNVGDVNEMKRRRVDDNCNNTCSHGLHVGTFDYACKWAGNGNVVLVKFDPADVVSIPVDHDFKKLRCSKYEVVDIARLELEQEVVDDYSNDFDSDREDEYERDENVCEYCDCDVLDCDCDSFDIYGN